MKKGMLFDGSKCLACRACQVACKQWSKLPAVPTINRGTYENPPKLTAYTWNRIVFSEVDKNGKRKWLFTRRACMHCSQAVCVWVCPSYARGYDDRGYVTIDQKRCVACGRCVEYCPFQVPKLGRDDICGCDTLKETPPRLVSYNCTFCRDRLEDGGIPACAKTCPSQAIQFGESSNLIKEGQIRVKMLKATHPQANLYGKKEMGGLTVLYILTQEPSIHGLPENPQMGTYPPFDQCTFPAWYSEAIFGGALPNFPSGADPAWYMQPGIAPAPCPVEPILKKLFVRSKSGGWAPILWGWLGLGGFGAFAAIVWSLRRRKTLEEGKQKNNEEA